MVFTITTNVFVDRIYYLVSDTSLSLSQMICVCLCLCTCRSVCLCVCLCICACVRVGGKRHKSYQRNMADLSLQMMKICPCSVSMQACVRSCVYVLAYESMEMSLSIYLPVCLSICQSMSLSCLYVYICLSVYLSDSVRFISSITLAVSSQFSHNSPNPA